MRRAKPRSAVANCEPRSGHLSVAVAALQAAFRRSLIGTRRARYPRPQVSTGPWRTLLQFLRGLPFIEAPGSGKLSPSEPVALDIPAIEVGSPLTQVGLRPDGTMEVPRGADYDRAAWYQPSRTPGEVGPAVIVGHIDSAERGPSVFFRLGELVAGDTISVARHDGTTAVFTVDAVGSYPKDDFPSREVYGSTDHAALRLITCGGEFDDRTNQYRDNIVVFAHLTDTTRS